MSFTSISNVSPGDLITADFMNSVLAELSALDTLVSSLSIRVAALEDELESPPTKTSKETKETKESKEDKETKEFKDKEAKESKESKDKESVVDKLRTLETGKSLIKDVEKAKESEKAVEKIVERKLTDKLLAERVTQLEQSTIDTARSQGSAPGDDLASAAPAPLTEPTAPEHFISAELRPALAASALQAEPDLAGPDSGGGS
jgi:hypothetical protein